MTDLEKLAIKRIRKLAESMDIPMSTVGYAAQHWTPEMIKDNDDKASTRFMENDSARREIIEWASALTTPQ